jgi:hypothetical protein
MQAEADVVEFVDDILDPQTEIEFNWQPFHDSPQEAAYHCTADVIGYGGAAGGGKTDLLLGKAFTQFKRGVIYRLNNPDLQDIIERGDEILDGQAFFVRGEKRRWDLPNGGFCMATSAERIRDLRKYRGRARDFIGIDEASEFDETVVRMLMGWLRTEDPNQHTQVVLTFNPPDETGEWLIEYFGAWINPDHANPAEDGDIRYFIRKDDMDMEVDSGDPVLINGTEYNPQSRTFFHARVEDNPVLLRTNYRDQLNTLPEPLRTQLLTGDMSVGRKDDDWQVIPTAWLLLAEKRYAENGKPNLKLRGLGADPKRGGKDEFGLARLFGDYFEVEGHTGAYDGDTGADLIIEAMQGETAPVYIDSIGIGSSVYDVLRKTHETHAMNAGESAGNATDKSGKYHFANQRSLWWWRFREALDPNSGYEIALPPIRKLRQDLRAPRYKRQGGKIIVESKEDIKKRTGRSTDYADPVVQVWHGVNMPQPKTETIQIPDLFGR